MTINSTVTGLIATLFLAMVAAASQAATLTPFHATYHLTVGGVTAGEATYELKIRGNDLEFKARVEPRGVASMFTSDVATEQSRLRLNGDGRLVPLHYEYRQIRYRRNIVHKQIEFDWAAGEARTRVDGERQTLAVEAGVIDRMALQLKLMRNRLAGDGADEIAYTVVEDHGLREYRFEVTGRETITTGAGDFETIRLERRHGSRTTVFWSAPALGYLPVRVEQQRSGYPTTRMDATVIDMPNTALSH